MSIFVCSEFLAKVLLLSGFDIRDLLSDVFAEQIPLYDLSGSFGSQKCVQ